MAHSDAGSIEREARTTAEARVAKWLVVRRRASSARSLSRSNPTREQVAPPTTQGCVVLARPGRPCVVAHR
jgi:hypothetical protein